MELDWTETVKALIFWGPGAVIAGLMMYLFYRLASDIGGKFIEAQQAQAEALGRQAQGMEGLRDSIHNFVMQDNSEHREMLVLLKYMAQGHQDIPSLIKKIENCPHLRRADENPKQ